MKKQTDIFGVEPEIGDLIVYNPPKYKGLIVAKCVGFSNAGLPELEIDKVKYWYHTGQPNSNGYYTPKTEFVVHKLKKGPGEWQSAGNIIYDTPIEFLLEHGDETSTILGIAEKVGDYWDLIPTSRAGYDRSYWNCNKWRHIS